MSDAAAFRATYSDFRLVKGRKVAQFVFEVPLEGANLAYEVLGGLPNPAAEVWCGIARLNGKEATHIDSSDPKPAPAKSPATNAPTRARRPISIEKRLAAQAGMCCADPVFHTFLYEHNMLKDKPEDTEKAEEAAKLAVRLICGVETRKDIIVGTAAGNAWDKLVSKFIAWKIAA